MFLFFFICNDPTILLAYMKLRPLISASQTPTIFKYGVGKLIRNGKICFYGRNYIKNNNWHTPSINQDNFILPQKRKGLVINIYKKLLQ
jgi:hypothetical protein